jgi:starvation-inducible outer membrane lipoprotein
MRSGKARCLAGFFIILLGLGLAGCASPPPERPDREGIEKNSDKAFQDLEREEDRNRDDY